MRAIFQSVALICLIVSGCAGTSGPDLSPQAGLGCIDDSSQCISFRQNALSAMLADPKRAWVHERPTPGTYATGVRLFAFKKKKRDLSCEELKRGKLEADNARPSLTTVRQHLTDAQMARATMLAAEVGGELKRELKRRCRKG